jgi:hypothetical protein
VESGDERAGDPIGMPKHVDVEMGVEDFELIRPRPLDRDADVPVLQLPALLSGKHVDRFVEGSDKGCSVLLAAVAKRVTSWPSRTSRSVKSWVTPSQDPYPGGG